MRKTRAALAPMVKFVVVWWSGSWLHMLDTFREALAMSARNEGSHVERWTYGVLPDGTHGIPTKQRL